MKSFEIRLATLTLAVATLASLFFPSCRKDNFFEPGQNLTDAGSIAALAAQHPERFFVPEKQGVPGRYIVMLEESYLRPAVLDETETPLRPTAIEDRSASRRQEVEAGVENFIAQVGIARDKVSATYGQLIAGFTAELTADQVKALLDDPNVKSIEQDMQIAVNDVLESVDQPGDAPEAQITPCGITRHGGSANGSTSDKWIWIVDSGVQSSHPDLNVVTNATYAKSFVGGTYEDCLGHGTHVAGTAAAKNNTIGVVGMSAGAWVVPVKIFDGCGNTYYNSTLLAALNHVSIYDIAGDVVNLSIGGYYGSGCATYSPLKAAVQNLGNSGTWVIIAAGNNGAYAGNYQPGCISGTKILTIANMTCANAWNTSSNYNLVTNGAPIDWIGVGTSVYSTYLGSGYAYMTGTSMATPHVAGIVHWRQANPLQNGTVTRNGVVYKAASRI
ncbi:MAG: hypothetical protein EPGJADBJ_00662 [Saprospiraceae bacterium]|nr:hypothetical protein [Saprospiraceae bacterium]